MSVRSFIDTNIFIYADAEDSPVKRQRALELIAEHKLARSGVVSLQVLQEYFVTATKKLKLDTPTARRRTQMIAQFDVGVPDVDDILGAIELHTTHGFSFWDGLVVRMATQTGCKIILSEDMQHARAIGGVKIVNPFVSSLA